MADSNPHTFDRTELLAQGDWMRALARRNDGKVAITGLPAGPLRIEVVSSRLRKWGIRGDELDPGPDEELTLRLKDE